MDRHAIAESLARDVVDDLREIQEEEMPAKINLSMTKDRFYRDLVRRVPDGEIVLGLRPTKQLLRSAQWRDTDHFIFLTIDGVERRLGRMDMSDEVRSFNEPDEDLPLDDKARRDYWLNHPASEVFGSVLTPTEFFVIDSCTDG